MALTPDKDDPSLGTRNDFDFRPKQSILGCPFAAHTRKMRPRADHKRNLGNDDDFVAGKFTNPLNGTTKPSNLDVDSDEEEVEGPEKEDSSVILRRGITFGPELGPDEKEKTTKSRGISVSYTHLTLPTICSV